MGIAISADAEPSNKPVEYATKRMAAPRLIVAVGLIEFPRTNHDIGAASNFLHQPLDKYQRDRQVRVHEHPHGPARFQQAARHRRPLAAVGLG